MCKNNNIKIRKNQVWRKWDTGLLIVICSRNRGETWNIMRLRSGSMSSSKAKAHHIDAHDILKHYELVQRKGGDEA